MRYLYLDIQRAKTNLVKQLGYNAKEDHLYRQLDKLNDYQKQLNSLRFPLDSNSLIQFNRLCRNFDTFVKRNS